jgi:uncharacterized membrane protein YhaH (DUF805 family)
MGAFNLLFATTGRLRRSRFWLAHLVLFVAWIVVAIAYAAALGDKINRGDADTLSSLANPPLGIWLLIALLSYMSFCISAKRLHDLDKSAWWMLLFEGPAILTWIASMTSGRPNALLSFATFIFGLWFIVELGFFRGTDGPNRYDSGNAPSSSPTDGGGSSWADSIQFDDKRPVNAAAPRIPAAAVKVASAPQHAARPATRTAPVRGPARPAGFGKRGLGTA